MNRRINIVLPEATIVTMARMAGPGERSRFIDQAVRRFVAYKSDEAIRAQLEMATIRDRDLDREIEADWNALDNEEWRRFGTRKPARPLVRGEAKSTSRTSTRR
jgi:hypothetical protein